MANWTRAQVLIALNLYCQLPFGRLHSRNPQIIEVAKHIGRTPDALAMKLTNLASLDPAITGTGRRGLSGASALDKNIWAEFQENPDAIGYESQQLIDELAAQDSKITELSSAFAESDFPSFDSITPTEKTATVNVRIKQAFFRKAILSSYEGRCCMTGISHSQLLIASHIIPWTQDAHNRLNPANGLCLSALHDKAFDRGLLTVLPDFSIKVSKALKDSETSSLAQDYLFALDGKPITLPNKFVPDRDFLLWHNKELFLN